MHERAYQIDGDIEYMPDYEYYDKSYRTRERAHCIDNLRDNRRRERKREQTRV